MNLIRKARSGFNRMGLIEVKRRRREWINHNNCSSNRIRKSAQLAPKLRQTLFFQATKDRKPKINSKITDLPLLQVSNLAHRQPLSGHLELDLLQNPAKRSKLGTRKDF